MKIRSFIIAGLTACSLAAPLIQAQQSSDQVYVYIVRNDRKILSSANADAQAQTNIVEPALKLADRSNRHFTAKATCKKPPCSAEAIVDAFFDYYASKFPKSAGQLSLWVRKNNANVLQAGGATLGTPIVLPCVPVSPQQDRRIPNGSRIVVPCGAITFGKTAERQTATLPATNATSPEDPRRKVNESLVRYTLAEYRKAFDQAPPENVSAVVTSRGSLTDPEARLMDVKFLGPLDSPEPDCEETPFRSAWKARSIDREKLKADAGKPALSLVLIDWDFTSGHGKKVRTVARRMLHCLGTPEIEPAIIDLHPRRNQQALEALVKLKCLDSNACKPEKEARFANVCQREGDAAADLTMEEIRYLDALCWIRTAQPPDGLQQKIDQYVLQAAFERTLNTGAWMNVSFDMRLDQAESIRQSIDRRPGSRSMIFAAAGNSGVVDVDASPQGLALVKRQRVVNVTFGDRKGTINGAVSSTDENARSEVAVLARGAGFAGDDLPPDTAGSSFASPWVATAAWVKRLVDSTGREDIRREIIRASRPVHADIFSKVTSGGFFDPFLLLVPDSRRIVAADELTSSIVGGRIEFTFFDRTRNKDVDDEIDFCGQGEGDFAIFKSDGKTFLWRRARDLAADTSGAVVELTKGMAHLQQSGVAEPEDLPLDKFIARFGEFTTGKVCP